MLDEIRDIEVIARGFGIRERKRLVKAHGKGRWCKLKGVAAIQYFNGRTCLAELHWYEAHGIGRRDFKVKRVLRIL